MAACEQAADLLAAHGVEVTVWDARLAAPLDAAMIDDALSHRLVVTVEDGIVDGGVGSRTAGSIREATAGGRGPLVVNCGVPTAYLAHGDATGILSRLGLDGPGIARDRLRAPLAFTRAPLSLFGPRSRARRRDMRPKLGCTAVAAFATQSLPQGQKRGAR